MRPFRQVSCLQAYRSARSFPFVSGAEKRNGKKQERRDVFINKSNYCFVKMIAVFLFLKPYRQTHVYRASRAERREVIVPGRSSFLSKIFSIPTPGSRTTDCRLKVWRVFKSHCWNLGRSRMFASSVRLAGVHVRLRSSGRSSRYVPTGR